MLIWYFVITILCFFTLLHLYTSQFYCIKCYTENNITKTISSLYLKVWINLNINVFHWDFYTCWLSVSKHQHCLSLLGVNEGNILHKFAQPLRQTLSIQQPSVTRCQSHAPLMIRLPNLCHVRADPVSTPQSTYANPAASTCPPHAPSVAILRQQYANGGPLLGPAC